MPPLTRDPPGLLAHDAWVRALAARLVRHPQDAEDLAQETWLASLQARGSAPRTLRSWVAGTARRLAAMTARSQGRRRHREQAAASVPRVPSPQEILDREALRRELVQAVLELPPLFRDAVLLRYFEDLPPREIARRCSLPVETVHSRIRRGLERLRGRLLEDPASGHRPQRSSSLVLLAGWKALKATGPASGPLAQALTGALIMTAKTKSAVAVVVLLCASLGTWLAVRDGEPPAAPPEEPTAAFSGPGAPQEPSSETDDQGQGVRQADTAIDPLPFQAPDEPETEGVPAERPFGEITGRVLYAADGSPAAGVQVRVLPWGAADPFFHEQWVRTDRKGRFHVARVRAGSLTLSPFLGGLTRAEVEPGETTEVELEIPEGCEVKGVVVDRAGAAVAGADIHVSRFGDIIDTRPVTTSAADGTFRIRHVEARRRSVGARKPGLAPSPLHSFMANVGETIEVKLVLDEPGGRVAGRVWGPGGRPVEGARVLVGPEEHRSFALEDGTRVYKAGPLRMRTDEEGRFTAAALAPGPNPVHVRAEGLAPWSGSVDVVQGSVHKLRVDLKPGVTIRGRILDAGGNPASRVEVALGTYGDFRAPWTRTAQDGTYELRGAAPGEIAIEADGDEQGTARATLHAAPGEELLWNARLAPGLTLSGQVLDERGNPLEGWNVRARGRTEDDFHSDLVRTDGTGRFEIRECLDAPYRIEASRRSAFYPSSVKKGVRPGQPVVLRVADADLPTASICGTVLGPGRKALSGVKVVPMSGRSTTAPILLAEAGTGVFQIDDLPPGRYTLSVRAPGFPRWRSRRLTLEPGQDLDLGTILLQPGGTIVVDLARLDGGPLGKVSLRTVRPDGRDPSYLKRNGGRAVSEPLTPGPYILTASGEGLATRQVRVAVTPDKATHLELLLQGGVRHHVILQEPAGAAPADEADLSVRKASGEVLVQRHIRRWGDPPLDTRVGLAPGTYILEASTSTGLQATTTVDVDTATAGGTVTVHLPLK